MPDPNPLHHHDTSIEERFGSWIDQLVTPDETPPSSDDGFADVATAARHAQRHAGIEHGATLPIDREDTIWEEIMHTAAPTTQPPLSYRPSPNTAKGHVTEVLPAPGPGWRSILTTAALIAFILAASAALIWRLAGPFGGNGGGDNGGAANQPIIADVGTPNLESESATATIAQLDAQEPVAIDGTSVAPSAPSPQTVTACDLSGDILLYTSEVPETLRQSEITYALVEPDGDFVLGCPQAEQPTHLMSGITRAYSLPWPGTVLLELNNGDGFAYNVATGGRIGVSNIDMAMRSIDPSTESSWLISSTGPDVQIINLNTMYSTKMAAAAGGQLPDGYTPTLVSNPDSPFAIVVDSSGATSTEDQQALDMPGTAFVIDETFDTRRWIDASGAVAVGSDVIAYQTEINGTPTVLVEDARSGDTLMGVTDNISTSSGTGQQFTFAGETLVYIDREGMIHRPVYRSKEPQILGPKMLDPSPVALHATGAANIVLIEHSTSGNTGTDTGGARPVSVLDAITGTVTQLPGIYPHFDPDASNQFASKEYLVTIEPTPDAESRIVAHLTNLTTGEIVVTSEPIDASVQEVVQGNNTLMTSASDAVAIVGAPGGEMTLLDATRGLSSTLTPPTTDTADESVDLQWHISPAPGGHWLVALGIQQPDEGGLDIAQPSDPLAMGAVAIAPISVEPEWTHVDATRLVGFIPGVETGSPPVEEHHQLEALEPVTLAPASTPLAASPMPAPSVGDCHLSGDIPLLTGDADLSSDTSLRLRDGVLTLHCTEVETMIAEGVTRALPASWPGAILVQMQDGSLHGINIVTGADATLGPVTDLPSQALGPRMRWLLIPATRDQTDWRFIDLHTMQSLLLSDVTGGALTSPLVARAYVASDDVVVIGFPGTPVTGQARPANSLDPNTSEPTPGASSSDLPFADAALVIDRSLEHTRWTEISNRPMTNAVISPDGELLAVARMTDDGYTVHVERLDDGTLVAETGITYDDSDSMALLPDGNGLLHLTGDRLYHIVWDSGVEIRTIADLANADAIPDSASQLGEMNAPPAGSRLSVISTTNPDVVITRSGSDSAHLIDVASGEVVEIAHLLTTPFEHPAYSDGQPPTSILAAVPAENGRSVIQLIDVSSAEAMVESDPIDVPPEQAVTLAAALRDQGNSGFVFLGDGRTIVLQAETGTIDVIPAPDPAVQTGWFIAPTPYGDFLTAAPYRPDDPISTT